jgi:hypothetical protein
LERRVEERQQRAKFETFQSAPLFRAVGANASRKENSYDLEKPKKEERDDDSGIYLDEPSVDSIIDDSERQTQQDSASMEEKIDFLLDEIRRVKSSVEALESRLGRVSTRNPSPSTNVMILYISPAWAASVILAIIFWNVFLW